MRLICLSLLLLAMMTAPFAVQAGILEFFFPKYNQVGPDPSRTLKAPFAEPDAAEAQGPVQPGQKQPQAKVESLPQNAIPLHLPHRNSEAVGNWLVTAVSEALTYDTQKFDEQSQKIAGYFDPTVLAQYQQFLVDNKVREILDSRNYQMRSFVKEKPLLLNEGVVGGSYRWLFEIPVMVSYMPSGMVDYKDVDPVNQDMRLTVQVGRNEAAANDGAILIERWTGKVEALKKK